MSVNALSHAAGAKVLVVDDDHEMLDLLAFALRRAGLTPLTALDAPSAIALFQLQQPHLTLLDIGLGDTNGLDVLREIRRLGHAPVIILSGRDGEDDKVRGLELGADDYLTKPFSHRELIARVAAHLRRSGGGSRDPQRAMEPLQVGPISLDPRLHATTKHGQALSLTAMEFRLLHYLMARAGLVVPTRDLLRDVWGYAETDGTDLVRVMVHRLRRKLEDDERQPRLIQTVFGVGFRFTSHPLATEGEGEGEGEAAARPAAPGSA